MKKVFQKLFATVVLSAIVAFAIASVFNADISLSFLSVFSVNTLVHFATSIGLINMPTGILGTYVGAPVETAEGGAAVQVINTERARGAYMAYKTKPEYAGKNITQSFLRLEAVIKNAEGKLSFKTFVGDGTTVAPTEQRLDRNDKFVITEIGLLLLSQETGKTNGILCTYPNSTVFGAAAADLEALFNGVLSVTINRTKFLPALDTNRFLKTPETMQSAAGNRDQFSLTKALVHLTPHIEIDGSGTNEIEVSFPTYAGWAGGTAAAGKEHRAVLYCHGLLISGGSANM